MTRIGALLAELPPAYFALVMSTGIISIACHFLGLGWLSRPFFWLNLGLYLVLWILTILRIVYYPRQILSDLKSFDRGMGFFTTVAATGVLGNQLALLMEAGGWASLCLGLGLGLWLFCMIAVLTALIGRVDKPSLAAGINGLWLMAPVGTQSLVILACLTVSQFPGYEDGLLCFALGMFLLGGLLSLQLHTLIIYRLLFFPLDPEDLHPSYWITMGVNAISTLAGAVLATTRYGPRLLEPLHQVLVMLTIFFWFAATWWLPLLICLMIWRHLIRRFGLIYSPHYWGLVFPLGMYATSTAMLSGLINFPALVDLALVILYAALAAWLLTFLGMLRSLRRSLFGASQTGQE
ncbi:MAG: tellurite resistance/C4-dicarboxylate transporter family protein [Deltaproteobacteria bacterium]|nr:tellurite resistance/C4-dicarboxylate transporter family protein [Deltaproteobacteria bacterium]